jgi:addiction module HigA family antidote
MTSGVCASAGVTATPSVSKSWITIEGSAEMNIRIEDLLKLDFSDVIERGSKHLSLVSPGEMLAEEFLKPLGISNYRLAKEIGVPAQRIGEIIAGRRSITADTDLRLCRFFGLLDGWWLRLQADFDTRVARKALAKDLAKIKPLKERAAGDQVADARRRGSR